MIKWLEVWGTAKGTGQIKDVAFIGSPNNNLLGFELTGPHSSNRGRGIGFEQVNQNTVKVFASLVGIVIDESNQYFNWSNYYQYDGTYDWFLKIEYSTSGEGGHYQTLLTEEMAKHRGNPPQGLGPNWSDTAIEKEYQITIPQGTTHIKISIYERDRTDFSRDPIFPIEQILEMSTPYAIRVGGEFTSLTTLKKKILKGKEDISKLSKNKIRAQNTWKDQVKIGR